MAEVDFSHPLHAASLYIEAMKYGTGAKSIEMAGLEEIISQIEVMKRETTIELTDFETEEMLRDAIFYGNTLARAFHINPTVALSVWVDGLLHGLAVAWGIKADESILETMNAENH